MLFFQFEIIIYVLDSYVRFICVHIVYLLWVYSHYSFFTLSDFDVWTWSPLIGLNDAVTHNFKQARAQEFLKGGRILDCWGIFEINTAWIYIWRSANGKRGLGWVWGHAPRIFFHF